MNEKREERIARFLVGKSKAINVRVPISFLSRIRSEMLKRVPGLARKERGLTTEAVLYFAARGLVDWEDERADDDVQKKDSTRSLDK